MSEGHVTDTTWLSPPRNKPMKKSKAPIENLLIELWLKVKIVKNMDPKMTATVKTGARLE